MSESNPLEGVSPFVFLSRARLEAVAGRCEHRRVPAGGRITSPGDAASEVYVLLDGRVEVLAGEDALEPLSTIARGQLFGERALLFDRERRLFTRARDDVELLALPGAVFLDLVQEEPAFAQAMADILRHKHGLFSRYRRLHNRVVSLIAERAFLISELLDDYRLVEPALHPGLADPSLDVGALGYAVARLPDDITRTTFMYLCTSLPAVYRDDVLTEAVPTAARRRAIWRVLPGKLVVHLRDDLTDPLDLLTCLCLYSVEARKLRRRIETPAAVRALAEAASQSPEQQRACVAALALSPAEQAGVCSIWPADPARRLHDMVMHHEDVGVECDLVARDYAAVASEQWVAQIKREASTLVDLDDPALAVHIVSANTHSVGNCLSPFLGRRRDDILAWGRVHHPEIDPAAFGNPHDLLYVLARHYERAEPEAREARIREERAGGHHRLSHTALTGIAVDLFDASRLDATLVDPGVQARPVREPALLVNVDYAFGQQAEHLLAGLLYLFGARVRSLAVLGKAGGLVGHRGDVLLAATTVLQETEDVYRLGRIGRTDLDASLLAELLPGRAVHEGTVLTVGGTLLQDRTLIQYYRRFFGCIGLEMEGSYFARQVHTAAAAGVVSDDIALRFAYYTSDLPLAHESNLSTSLSASEGVPPLYAITRAVLRRILA